MDGLVRRPNEVLRACMADAGFTSVTLADAMNIARHQLTGEDGGCTEQTVRRWLSGETSWPQTRYHALLSSVLDRSMTDLGFIPRSTRGAVAEHQPMSTMAASATNLPEEPKVLRREFVTLVTSTLTPVRLPALRSSGRLGMSDVEQVRTALTQLHATDDMRGGTGLAQVAAEYARRIRDAAEQCTFSERVGKALYAVLGEISASGGWFAFDADDQGDARRQLDDALRASLLSGDRMLQARVWSLMSRQAYELGRPHETISTARVALETIRPMPDPRLSVMLHSRVALGHGLLREPGYGGRSLHTAETQLDRVDTSSAPPVWLAFVGPGEIAGLSSMCHYDLGQFRQAEESSQSALALTPADFGRNRFAQTVQLARSQLAQRKVDEAVSTASKALDLQATVKSARWSRRLHDFRVRLRDFKAPSTTEFFERFDASQGGTA